MSVANGNRIFANNSNIKDMAFQGYALKSGLGVTGGGAGVMTVVVAEGFYWVAGKLCHYAGGSVVVTIADASFPRKDIVSLDSAGTLNITDGTPAAASPIGSTGPDTITPIPPDIPTDETTVCEVWVGAAVTGILTANISNIGVFSDTAYGAYDYGLSFEGVVSGVVGSPTSCQCSDLIGYGDNYFKGYWINVVWDKDGAAAAPQGEKKLITAYTSATGSFTYGAFTAPVTALDKVLIVHPAIMGDIVVEVGEMDDAATAADLADLYSTSVHAKLSRALLWLKDIYTAVITTIPGLHTVPAKNATTDANMRDVIGKKDDDAVYAVGTQKSLEAYIKGLINAGIAVKGTVVDIAPTCYDFDTDLTEATDDHYDGMLMIFIGGVLKGQANYIEVYTGAGGNCDFSSVTGVGAWTEAPGNGDAFIILPDKGGILKGFLYLLSEQIDALVVPDPAGTAAGLHATTDGLIGDVQALVDTLIAGKNQVFVKAITSAANAGDVTLATATTQAVLVKGLTIRSNGATTADFSTIGIYGATGKRATLLTTTQGTLANLALDGNQQTSDFGQGGCQLNANETIVATLTGGGATAVAFTVYFTVAAIVDGGYLA